MADREEQSAEVEHQYHHYRGNVIPWFVRLMWLGFWVFAIAYTVIYLFPSLQTEFFGRQ
ncbi:MAG: hypothetical protein KDB14_27895 [Planctomycetales bacterium]|nr:hypothetical protein [Planctomycetales bacterium]